MNESHSIKVVPPFTWKNPEKRKPDPVNAKDRQGKLPCNPTTPPPPPYWPNQKKLDIIKDDTGAMSAYAHGRYGFGASNPEVRSQLPRYCQFDTTAMVMTGKHWVN